MVILSAAISGSGQGEQWERFSGLLWEMVHQLLTLTVVSWSAVIGACGKGEQWEEVLELLKEIVHQLLMLDVMSYQAVICASPDRQPGHHFWCARAYTNSVLAATARAAGGYATPKIDFGMSCVETRRLTLGTAPQVSSLRRAE